MINWVMLVVAAVPGTPDPPAPIDPPDLWLTWFNDDWGIPNHGTDDHRTNAFELTVRVYQQVRLIVRDDMLTDRDGGTREDQALIGVAWKDPDVIAVDLWPSIGLRLDGNLGGAWVQNHWHGPNSQVDLAYDDQRSLALYLGGLVHWTRWEYARWHPDVTVAGTVDSHGAEAADVTARCVLRFEHVQFWAGLRLQLRHADDVTEAAVADFERGLWLDYGLVLDGGLVIASQWSLRQDDGVGAISIITDF